MECNVDTILDCMSILYKVCLTYVAIVAVYTECPVCTIHTVLPISCSMLLHTL